MYRAAMSSYSFKEKKGQFFNLVRNIFVRFITCEGFDISLINFGKGTKYIFFNTKYFLKAKLSFVVEVYTQKRKNN